MNEEIKNSLLAVAELNRLQKCSTVQLERLQDAIVNNDPVEARRILSKGNPFGAKRLWADNAFQATLAAQVSDHLGAEKLKRYSQVYQMIRDNGKIQEVNDLALSDLAVMFFVPKLPTSPEARYAQLREVANARLRTSGMQSTGETIASYSKKDLGLEVTQRDYLAAPGRAEFIKMCEAGAVRKGS